ncbi:MAG: DUF4956 domain-containing protein [Anaerolineae bacterium]|jgi:hypothetical protein
MDDLLSLASPAPLPLETLAINLLLSIILGSAIAWFYTRYGRSLSNRARFAFNLPALSLTTVLIISIIKSSLALSLGLVGALSIVRFRTAIKEPEELVYLFIAIAIGLGLGADQRLPTVLALAVILAYLFVRTFLSPRGQKNNLYFSVVGPSDSATFVRINELLLEEVNSVDLRRLDNTADNLRATYLLQLPSSEALVTLMDSLRANLPACEFSFVEQDNTLGG